MRARGLRVCHSGNAGDDDTASRLDSNSLPTPFFFSTHALSPMHFHFNLTCDKNLKLKVWDTAGQERFRTITASYFRGTHGILMVYDVGNRKSFDAVNFWMQKIQQQADSSVALILVGNKCDMREEQRQVSDDEGRALAEKFGIPFHLTSAKTNTGVDDAFLDIATRVMEIPRSPRGSDVDSATSSMSELSLPQRRRNRRRAQCC